MSSSPADIDEALEFINEWDINVHGVSIPVRKLIPPDIFETIRLALTKQLAERC